MNPIQAFMRANGLAARYLATDAQATLGCAAPAWTLCKGEKDTI